MGLLVCCSLDCISLGGGDVPGGNLMWGVGIMEMGGDWISIQCLMLETLKVIGQGDGF